MYTRLALHGILAGVEGKVHPHNGGCEVEKERRSGFINKGLQLTCV